MSSIAITEHRKEVNGKMERGFYSCNIEDLVWVKLDKSNRIVTGISTACFESEPNSSFSTTA